MTPEPPPLRLALRVAALAALMGLTFALTAIGILALRASRTAGELERASDDAAEAAVRFERTSREFDRTLDQLRSAARSLERVQGAAAP